MNCDIWLQFYHSLSLSQANSLSLDIFFFIMASAQFKIVLLGESAVGKSSVVQRFVKDAFSDQRESTIGAAFLTHTINIGPSTVSEGVAAGQALPAPPSQNVAVKFEIWDTAGQERYRALASMYYRNAQGALVVYDVSSPASLEQARYWTRELERHAPQQIVVALVGNKMDLVEEEPETDAAARELAEEYGLIWFKTSAKTGENVQGVFQQLALRLPYDAQLEKRRGNQRGSETVKLGRNSTARAGVGEQCAC